MSSKVDTVALTDPMPLSAIGRLQGGGLQGGGSSGDSTCSISTVRGCLCIAIRRVCVSRGSALGTGC